MTMTVHRFISETHGNYYPQIQQLRNPKLSSILGIESHICTSGIQVACSKVMENI